MSKLHHTDLTAVSTGSVGCTAVRGVHVPSRGERGLYDDDDDPDGDDDDDDDADGDLRMW